MGDMISGGTALSYPHKWAGIKATRTASKLGNGATRDVPLCTVINKGTAPGPDSS